MTIESTYRIYGGELSYFTRKLEAAMIFYGAPFEMLDKNKHDPREIEARSGTHQVPVLQTPENWMIGDTTPLMRLLDDRFPARRMFPKRPLGILVQVVEEYFDEWIARTMVHYRWHYPESAEFASLRMARGVAGYSRGARGRRGHRPQGRIDRSMATTSSPVTLLMNSGSMARRGSWQCMAKPLTLFRMRPGRYFRKSTLPAT